MTKEQHQQRCFLYKNIEMLFLLFFGSIVFRVLGFDISKL